MRTTIRIDDDLYRRAKARAASSGQTVAELIEDAVRVALRPRRGDESVVAELPVFGGSGVDRRGVSEQLRHLARLQRDGNNQRCKFVS